MHSWKRTSARMAVVVKAAGLVLAAGQGGACWADPPANDPCGASIDHPVPPSGGVVMGTVVGASNDGTGCGSNRLPGPDVYHTFIPATRGPWRLDLCDTESGWDTVLSVHRHPTNPTAIACPASVANRIAGGCDDDGCSDFFGQVPSRIRAVSLEPGVRYTIRVGAFDGASVTDVYRLAVTDLGVMNDRCEDAGAAAIPGSGGVVFGDLSDATTDGSVDAAACLGSTRSGTARDVYHLFTPQTSGRWTFSTCLTGFASPGDTVVSVHTGCPASAANAIACNNDGCETQPGSSVVSVDLVAGVTYRVRVAEYLRDRFDALLGTPRYALSASSETMGRCCATAMGVCEVTSQAACGSGGVFTAWAVCEPQGSCPAGGFDQCAQAVNLTAGELVQVSATGLTGTALGSCTALTADGWFTFTAPAAGEYQLFAQPDLPMLGLVASIYPGAGCPASAGGELECGFVFGDGPKFALAAGQSVKIRVAVTGEGRFAVRVSPTFDSPPANDLCGQAGAVSLNSAVTGTFAGATGNLPVEGCSSGQRDVWYSFTAPTAGRVRVMATPVPGSGITLALSVSSACGNAATPLACAGEPFDVDATTELVFAAAAGAGYRVRVSTNAEFGEFSLELTPAPAAPGNDVCAAAATLGLNTPVASSTRFAEGSTGAISVGSCSSAGWPDSWFRFRPTVSGAYEVTAQPATETDPSVGLGVFVGCPSGLATDVAYAGPIGAGSANTVRFLATANTDYLVRAATYPGQGSDFSMTVSAAATGLGACCARDGGCFVTGADDCGWIGGTYRGDAVACSVAGCPPAGRCCFTGSSSCAITSQSDCTGPGASFTAGGACDPVGCPAGTAPANDLCQNAPTLTLPATVLTALDLADAEGPAIPAGFCSTTQSLDLGLDRSVYYRFTAPASGPLDIDVRLVNFPEPMLVLYRGAACGQLVDVDCTFRFQVGERRSFEVVGGETYYLGLGIRNDPNFFNEGGLIGLSLSVGASSGACCRGTGCTVEDAGACAGSGVFQGTGTACGPAGNPTTCCPANFNGVGGVTVQDIFDFLAAYFTADPAADINGVGGVTVQDIFDYLTAYFAGCA